MITGKTIGSFMMAAGCLSIGISRHFLTYYCFWVIFGMAMRLTLYDAAMARIGGTSAKRPIS